MQNSKVEWFTLHLIIMAALLLPARLLANDTFVFDNGSSVYPINTDKIRMVSEHITVRMEGKNNWRAAHVTCSFLFENPYSADVNAKIGFPAEDPNYLDRGEGEKIVPPLYNFISYIEEKKVNVNIKVQEVPNSLAGIYWYTWDAKFPSQKRLSLKNTYDTALSISYEQFWFHYILKTGANWKGPIEQTVVEVIYKNSEDLKKRFDYARPDKYQVQGNKIVWTFKNFKPTDDIYVYEKRIKE